MKRMSRLIDRYIYIEIILKRWQGKEIFPLIFLATVLYEVII